MRFRVRWPIALLLLVFLALAVRLVWVVGASLPGWTLIKDDWVNHAVSLVYWKPPLNYQTPEEQARFWKKQLPTPDEIKQNPHLALGAAWRLNSSHPDFLKRHYASDEDSYEIASRIAKDSPWDNQDIQRMLESYQTSIREDCLKLMETATQDSPEDIELWRNRALLLFRINGTTRHSYLEPRDPDWLAVLDECARHDPDNALYDYLAGYQLWYQSTEVYYNDQGTLTLIIKQSEEYAQAQNRLKAALKKTYLQMGSQGFEAGWEFLSETPLSFTDQIRFAASLNCDWICEHFLNKLINWQSTELQISLNRGQIPEAVNYARNLLQMADQLTEEQNGDYALVYRSLLRTTGLNDLLIIQREHAHTLTPEEVIATKTEFEASLLEDKILIEAADRYNSRFENLQKPPYLRMAILTGTAQNFLILSLVFYGVAGMISRLSRKHAPVEEIKPGYLGATICWLLGTGVSFFVWGIVPDKMLSYQAEFWIVPLFYWVSFILLIAGALSLIKHGINLPWSQTIGISTLMFLIVCLFWNIKSLPSELYSLWKQSQPVTLIAYTAVLALLAAFLVQEVRAFIQNKQLNRNRKLLMCVSTLMLTLLVIPVGIVLGDAVPHASHMRNLLSPVTWKEVAGLYSTIGRPVNQFQLIDSPWICAWLLWYWNDGELFAVGLSLLFLLLWYLKIRSKTLEGGFTELLQTRKRCELHSLSRMMAKMCLMSALFFLLIYLATLPEMIQPRIPKIQDDLQLMTHSSRNQQRYTDFIVEVRSEKPLLNQFKQEIRENILDAFEQNNEQKKQREGQLLDIL
ncbi:hypothetical protein [Gimesia sp.]|uniref:hypothetical protein n=1 Tax=Gimesia sp. TaxID=2024833 RepID=UPI003A8FF691